MASLCIIPARGGSKRIPRKNVKDFCGKPVIAYSIEAALNSNLFDEVMVSTDDLEIAEVAKRYGAAVPFMRSEINSNDYATTVDVLLEVLQQYGAQGKMFETACCIYATSPLIRTERLYEGRKQLLEKKCDTVFPIVRFSYPIGRALQMVDNKVTMIWPENLTKRSQDLPAAYHDAGQWYWFNCAYLLREKKLWTDNTFGVEVDELEVQDIDTMMDWKLAELKYELL
jgi:pseudaminic acid cytidylyltransferase